MKRYATGQKPDLGDVVSDKNARVATVTHMIHYRAAPAELVIEWEDGTIGIRHSCYEALMLVGREGHVDYTTLDPWLICFNCSAT